VQDICVLEPTKSDADGLEQCLGTTLKNTGIDNILQRENVLGVHEHPVLVGCSTDGASVNTSTQNVMQGKLKASLPGHGAMPIDLNWHARIALLVISFTTLTTCY